MSFDWNKSGRIDNFQFEKISNRNLDESLGMLECQVVNGTLTYSYYSELKVSGSLEVINAKSSMSEDEYLIRIWYCPELDGVKKKIELGTFYFTANLQYQNGTYKGALELRSLLARHIDDVVEKKWTLGKDKKISELYKAVFKALGGTPKIEGVNDIALSKAHIFDAGTSPMEILQFIADQCNGEITIDTHGRTILQKYKTPSKKAKNITNIISANSKSVILPGIEITNTFKEIPNRAICIFEKDDKQYIGKAQLAANEARSFQNIGRYITAVYTVNTCKTPYKTNLEKKAATYLKKANNKTIYYEFDTYYQPIQIGEVITLKYDDIVVNGLVSDIDLSLSIGAQMRVKIRKV